MTTLRIEHEIHDYAAWKAAFDRDPADRVGSGVRSFAVYRPIDDEHYIMIDLDFDGTREAEAFVGTMQRIWRSPQAAPALKGAPHTRIIETVDGQHL